MLTELQAKKSMYFYIIDILIVLAILYYLYEMRTCDCFFNLTLDNNVTQMTNLYYALIISEVALLIFLIVQMFKIRHHINNSILPSLFNLDKSYFYISVSVVILIIIYILIYKIVQTINKSSDLSCQCYPNNLRYLFFFQIMVFSISILYVYHKITSHITKKTIKKHKNFLPRKYM